MQIYVNLEEAFITSALSCCFYNKIDIKLSMSTFVFTYTQHYAFMYAFHFGFIK